MDRAEGFLVRVPNAACFFLFLFSFCWTELKRFLLKGSKWAVLSDKGIDGLTQGWTFRLSHELSSTGVPCSLLTGGLRGTLVLYTGVERVGYGSMAACEFLY